MKTLLMRKFALSEAGASGMIQAVSWCFICNVALMLPVVLVMATAAKMTELIATGESVMRMWPAYPAAAALIVLLLWILHYFQYGALYLTVFSEGTNRRVALAERLRRLPLSYFGQKDLSDLTTTLIADEAVLEQLFSHYIPEAFATLFSVGFIGILLLCADWRMGLAVIWVIPIAIGMTVGSRRIQNRIGRASIEKKRVVTDKIQEGIEHIQDIKAFHLQASYAKELQRQVKDSVDAALRAELITGCILSAGKAFIRLGIASTVLAGVYLMQRGELTFLYFLGFMLAAARMYDPVEMVMENIAATFAAGLKIERMRAIQEEPVQGGTTEFAPEGFDLRFEHVEFAYQGEEEVIHDLSFTAKQGEVTALIGPSGSGKSTVSKLAARFWDIQSGKITLGGVDISGVDTETLLRYYAIVFQEVVLFNDTVMENIRLGRKGASDEEVLQAARAAQCESFAANLPDGYDTVIGENGVRLSGGERQRISIARAILKDAPVILLDEATASLDVENETEVQEALGRLVTGKTVMIIAHRMRTVAQADHLIVLENGSITEEGTPKELLAKDGFYARMARLQQESAEWKL